MATAEVTTLDRTRLRLADADQHYYEPTDAISGRIDPAFGYAFRWVTGQDGRTRLLLGDRVF